MAGDPEWKYGSEDALASAHRAPPPGSAWRGLLALYLDRSCLVMGVPAKSAWMAL